MALFDWLSRKNNTAPENGKKQKKNLYKELLLQNLEEAKEEYPDKAPQLDAFLPLISEELKERTAKEKHQKSSTEEGAADEETVQDARTVFSISEDKMEAFACILPPAGGGRKMEQDGFEEDLRYSGITYGVNEKLAREILEEERYLYPFPLAEGTPAEDGRDGEIIEYFQRSAVLKIEAEEGEILTFGREHTMQTVKQDAVICRKKPAEKAKDGKDVVGNVLKGKDGEEVELRAGENTIISSDQKCLLAESDGVVSFSEEGNFCVHKQRTIIGDVGRHTGNVYWKGDLFISGNVREEVIIKAAGNIIINGDVREATITAGGSIRIEKSCTKGQAETVLKAEGQIQCAAMEDITAEANGSIFGEVILDSRITSGGSVYALSGRGLLIGGEIKARGSVAAKEIGNVSQCHNKIYIGYEPGFKEKLQETQENFKTTTLTLDKLRKNVSTLKSFGNKISLEKRELLSKLEEQKNLYEKRLKEQTEELKSLTVASHKLGEGKITCEKMYPTTEIHIGDKKKVILNTMNNCKISLQGGIIAAR